MIHLLVHDFVLDPLNFVKEPSLLFEGSLDEDVVLTELLGELKHNGSLLFASFLYQA